MWKVDGRHDKERGHVEFPVNPDVPLLGESWVDRCDMLGAGLVALMPKIRV